MNRLEALLAGGPVLFDGAMGTELYARGIGAGRCLEELNVTDPLLVGSVHRDYIAAGAQVIETNTFGGNRFRLGEHYLEDRVREINVAGARLAVEARNASGRAVLVAGSVGPLGKPLEPIGAIKVTSAERIFREQVQALLEGGAEMLVFETFTSTAELELAVRVARETAPDVPIVACMSFEDETVSSTGPAEAAAGAEALVMALRPHRVSAIGANCGSGPQAALAAARRLLEAAAETVAVMPNAGLPERVAGRLVYTTGPEYFANYTRQYLADGVSIIGGCCGTRPAHTAAMRAVIDHWSGGARRLEGRMTQRGVRQPGRAPSSRLAAQLAGKKFAISVELTPPRGIDPRRMLEGARFLKEAGVDFANVTDSAMARVRMGVLSCAALVQQQVGLEAIAHFTTRDRNVMAIQSELIGAHALGIRNVLCLRGDPPRVGDHPTATGIWEVNAVGLITILANLNQGLDANGTPIGQKASFFIGTAVNPNAANLDRELALLRRKIEAGANFVVTQPVYDADAFLRFRERLGDLSVPVLVGVLPLVSQTQAEYLHHEVPGIVIPDAIRARVAEAAGQGATVGAEMALELLGGVQSVVDGAYVIPPLGRYELAAQVVAQAREAVGSRAQA